MQLNFIRLIIYYNKIIHMSYQALILIAPGYQVSLKDVEMKLVNFFKNNSSQQSMRTQYRENKLILTFDDWSLYINLDSEAYVLQESLEMANIFGQNHPERAIIATCDSRFEINSDSDESMDHFNDYVLVLEQLCSIPKAFAFDNASQDFM